MMTEGRFRGHMTVQPHAFIRPVGPTKTIRNHVSLFALRLVLFAGALLLESVVVGQSLQEYPPSLPHNLINGGRVQSIAVNPSDSRQILAAHQYGGLWKTSDSGRSWSHVRGLNAVWVVDVAYSRDGRTIIATRARDLRPSNGGGIWVSRDDGATWRKPLTGDVPRRFQGPRTNAYGISYAPDEPNKIYVATDHGIATSNDNGATWSHRSLPPAGARSVQALPGNRAIAVTPTAVFVKDTADSWAAVRGGSFSDGFKNIDVAPDDSDKVFILQDYNTLLLYEVAADRWTDLPLPGGGARGPFIRASRGAGGAQAIDLWVGLGWNLYKASCADIACVRRLQCIRRPGLDPEPCDWRKIVDGLHNDSGHLAVDGQKRIVMYGSDGGLFKPLNPEGTRWTLASPPGSGMNSYQITSLAGTNYYPLGNSFPSLYFATQDNNIWASPDGGRTWPRSDCAEGWQMQTSHDAVSTADPHARVAYGTTGCWRGGRVSDANLTHQRDDNMIDDSGRPIRGTPGNAFLLSAGNWIRFVDERSLNRQAGSWRLYVSTDNLEHWRQIATTELNPGGYTVSSGPASNPTAYTALQGAGMDQNGNARIALARLSDVLRISPRDIIADDLIYLPLRGNLGVRATEFDWQPIFGLDPRDPDFLIAPDVINKTVWVSSNGGRFWRNDDALTGLVTQGEQLLFQEGTPGQVLVTNISFSPYERNLILVGTREAGIVYSDDRGNSWLPIPASERMLYITGFFFSRDGTVYASTYGRGLWKIDMRRRPRSRFPDLNICGYNHGFCNLRIFRDPQKNVISDFDWKNHDVLLVFGGRINGLMRSNGGVKAITISPQSSYRFYAAEDKGMPEIIESSDGAGFGEDRLAEFALKNQEVITGVIFKDEQPVGYLTSKEQFKLEQEPLTPKAGKDIPADKPGVGLPYLSIHTASLLGPGLVQTGGQVTIVGRGLTRGAQVEVRLDGNRLAWLKVGRDSTVSYHLNVTEKVPLGEHRVEVIQKTGRVETKAVASFVRVRKGDDRVPLQ